MIIAKARSAFSKKKKNESSLSLFLERRKESEGLALIHSTNRAELDAEGDKICSGLMMMVAKARSADAKRKKKESSLSIFLKRRIQSEGLALIHSTKRAELGAEGDKICSGLMMMVAKARSDFSKKKKNENQGRFATQPPVAE